MKKIFQFLIIMLFYISCNNDKNIQRYATIEKLSNDSLVFYKQQFEAIADSVGIIYEIALRDYANKIPGDTIILRYRGKLDTLHSQGNKSLSDISDYFYNSNSTEEKYKEFVKGLNSKSAVENAAKIHSYGIKL